MPKVHPETIIPIVVPSTAGKNLVVLTVWKKSLLFNCDGFTVIDSNGNLVYRVDSYDDGGNGEIILMDAYGRSLLTIRRQRLSVSDNWLVYDGEMAVNPLFTVAKHMNILSMKSLASVSLAGSSKRKSMYKIEGSYTQNCCVMYDDMQRCVADIRPKEAKGGVALGGDVFQLVVQPTMNPTTAMALLVIFDQMYGHSKHFRT